MYTLQVNDISFHPVHGTLATVGSDCKFSFWDKDARTKLKTSEQFDQPITACNFNAQGTVFAYSTSYDWSKVCNKKILENHFDLTVNYYFNHLHRNQKNYGQNFVVFIVRKLDHIITI